jgi:replicative DNA helicase
MFLVNYSSIIKEEYFDSEVHKLLVRLAMEAFADNGVVPSAETMQMKVIDHIKLLNLEDEYKERIVSLLNSVYMIDLTDFSETSSRIVDFGKTKRMEEMSIEVAKALSTGQEPDDVWSMIDRYREMGAGDCQIGACLKVEFRRIEEMVTEDPLYKRNLKIKTGLPTLDTAFLGGLGRREVGIVIAFTGFGKSTLLINFGVAAAKQGKHVLHASIGELETNDIVLRYASRFTEIPFSDIILNPGIAQAGLDKILDTYSPQVAVEYFPAGTKVAALRSWVSRCKYRYNMDPALLLIDNAGDLSSSKQRYSSNEYEEHGNIYTELKGLAHDFDLAVWTDSQTNRAGFKADTADLDTIADSMKKAHKADVVLSINQTPEESKVNEARLFLAKARRYDKSISTIKCKVDRECYLVREIP